MHHNFSTKNPLRKNENEKKIKEHLSQWNHYLFPWSTFHHIMSYLGTGNRLKNENQNNLQGLLYFTKLHTNTLTLHFSLVTRNKYAFLHSWSLYVILRRKKKKKEGEFLVVLDASLFYKDLRSFTALHITSTKHTKAISLRSTESKAWYHHHYCTKYGCPEALL